MRRGVLGRLNLQKLIGILVDGIENVFRRDRGIVDRREVWKLYRVPFGLRLEELSQISAHALSYHFSNRQHTNIDRDGLCSPFLRLSFLSLFTFARFLSGGGFVKPSLVSAWVRFFPI